MVETLTRILIGGSVMKSHDGPPGGEGCEVFIVEMMRRGSPTAIPQMTGIVINGR
jgi:hypothetical protein